MKEQQVQVKKIKELEAQGYYVIKLTMTNKNGIPDLLAKLQVSRADLLGSPPLKCFGAHGPSSRQIGFSQGGGHCVYSLR